MTALAESRLPLPLLRRGKVREVYEVDAEHLLLVASDRVSAFDVVMREPIPRKGAVLTQISAFWFERLAGVFPSHYVTARTDEIVAAHSGARRPHAAEIAGRAMLVRRTEPVPFECVVRGYLSGSAWAEYRERGTLAGEPLPPGLVESSPARSAAVLAGHQGGDRPRRERDVRPGGRRARPRAGRRLRDASFARVPRRPRSRRRRVGSSSPTPSSSSAPRPTARSC